jgi:hypothetical protein
MRLYPVRMRKRAMWVAAAGLFACTAGTSLPSMIVGDAGEIGIDAGELMRDAGRMLVDAGNQLRDSGTAVRDAGRALDDAAQAQAGVQAETFEANCFTEGAAQLARAFTDTSGVIAVTAFACSNAPLGGLELDCVVVLPGFTADRLQAGCPAGRTRVRFTVLR